MANQYSATLTGAADDGTNTYLFVSITDGTHTMQPVQVMVPTGTSATAISSLLQNIANNQPTIAAAIQGLINVPVKGQ